jgi:hypothetical protein
MNMTIKRIAPQDATGGAGPVLEPGRPVQGGSQSALQSPPGLARRMVSNLGAMRPRATLPPMPSAAASARPDSAPLRQGRPPTAPTLLDLLRAQHGTHEFDDVDLTRAPRQSAAPLGKLAAPDAGPVAAPVHPRELPSIDWKAPLRTIPEGVRFAGAEQRTFSPTDKPRMLGKRVQIAQAGADGARPSTAGAAASVASERAAREKGAKGERTLRQEAVLELNGAVGRLQALAIQDPERARQAIQNRILPGEVLGDLVGPASTKEVIDLHAMYQEVEADAAAGRRSHGVVETFGVAAQGIAKVREETLRRAAMEAQMGQALSTPELKELPPGPLKMVSDALKGGQGQALQRMSERAARASPKTLLDRARRVVQNKPQALEGTRRQDFVARVDRDIAALVKELRIEPRHAALLLQRAVHTGQLGADKLRPEDRALLLEVLAAKASNGGD